MPFVFTFTRTWNQISTSKENEVWRQSSKRGFSKIETFTWKAFGFNLKANAGGFEYQTTYISFIGPFPSVSFWSFRFCSCPFERQMPTDWSSVNGHVLFHFLALLALRICIIVSGFKWCAKWFLDIVCLSFVCFTFRVKRKKGVRSWRKGRTNLFELFFVNDCQFLAGWCKLKPPLKIVSSIAHVTIY